MPNIVSFLLQRVLCNTYVWAIYYFSFVFLVSQLLRNFSRHHCCFLFYVHYVLPICDSQLFHVSLTPSSHCFLARPRGLLITHWNFYVCRHSSTPKYGVCIWILGNFGFFVVCKTRFTRKSRHIFYVIFFFTFASIPLRRRNTARVCRSTFSF